MEKLVATKADTKTAHPLKALGAVSSMTLLSRIFGFLRDMVLAAAFGASAGYDAFLISFRIPNFMRRLFAEGAFAQAFVPVLSDVVTQESPEQAQVFINRVFGCLTLVLAVVTVLGMLSASWVYSLFAPGFASDSWRFQLGTWLLLLTFPYLFFIALTAFCGAILNTYRVFALPALTPIFLNLSLIGAALWLAPFMDVPILALGVGVFIAGVVQLSVQIPSLWRLRRVPRLAWGWSDPRVRQILRLMGPAVLGASVVQLNMLIDAMFASFLPVGSISWLYYADRLLEFPLGIIGVALGTVLLPTLSRAHAEGDHIGREQGVAWGLRMCGLIGLPAAVGLGVLAPAILATLFQRGAFLAHDVHMSTQALQCFALGLPFYMAVKVLFSAYSSKKDTRFPVRIAIVALLTNALLNAILIGPLAHAGLALASSVSGVINAVGLYLGLRGEWTPAWRAHWIPIFGRALFAAALMGVALEAALPSHSEWSGWGAYQQLVVLMGLISGAVAVYGLTLWLLGVRPSVLRP